MRMPIGSNIVQMHQSFFDFWNIYKRADGRVSIDDVRPNRLKSILPNIVKIRTSNEGSRFALVGTQVVEEYQQDFTGMLVQDHPHEVCRETYLSMIDHMNSRHGIACCFGMFCYLNRHYLRTMESGVALAHADSDKVAGYLVLVTIDHAEYMDKLYHPMPPEQVLAGEANIVSQADFNNAMQGYHSLSA